MPRIKTYDRIIQASLELFNEHGERAITTNHIAAHLGISPGNLYYHFRNKEEIIYQIFLQYRSFMQTRLSLPGNAKIEASDMLKYLDTAFHGMWKFRFMFYDLPGLLARNEKLAEAYQKFVREEIIEILTRLFREFVKMEFIHADEDEIETLVVNCWIIVKFWFAFQQTANPKDPITEETSKRGVRQVLCLLRPYITAQYKPLFAQIESAFRTTQSTWQNEA
ncbi:MAG: TetR/AcrR family transcriptional regulator [Chitinivorax sp.]